MNLDLNSGGLAPLTSEVAVDRLAITGSIPKQLQGTLIRNGPNPFSGRFQGEGVTQWWPEAAMLHAIELRNGSASYRNRWVRTRAYANHFGLPEEHTVESNPNVNVIYHNGEILALAEGGLPLAVDETLTTLGPPRLPRLPWPGETAHPKVDPRTGECMTFRADWAAPLLRYGVLGKQGEVRVDRRIDQSTPVMMHDMAITQHHSILFDLSVGYDFNMLHRGHRMPLRWLPEKTCQLIILPRQSGQHTRIDIQPCFIQHIVNAYELSAQRLLLDVVRYPFYFRLDETTDQYQANPLGVLWRYAIDLQTGTVEESELSDQPVELPRINEAHTGYPYRYGYMVAQPSDEEMRGIVRYDFETQNIEHYDLSPGDQNSEPVYVAKPGDPNEDGGWLLSVAYRGLEDRSDLLILNAADVSAGPVATVHIPGRIPAGFHGAWIAA